MERRLPKIVERKIMKASKPSGLKQYLITLPKDYAQSIIDEGIHSLIIIYDYGLVAFPNHGKRTEIGLLEFLKAHPNLMQFFMKSNKRRNIGE